MSEELQEKLYGALPGKLLDELQKKLLDEQQYELQEKLQEKLPDELREKLYVALPADESINDFQKRQSKNLQITPRKLIREI